MVRDVAARMGIVESCLHRWKGKQHFEQGPGRGLNDADHRALATAKQQMRDLEMEVKILRRVTAAVEEIVPQEIDSALSRNPWLKR